MMESLSFNWLPVVPLLLIGYPFTVVLASSPERVLRFHHQSLDQEEKWTKFKLDYDKVYSSPKEEEWRRHVFLNNLDTIERHNARAAVDSNNITFWMGTNKYADMEHKEFVRVMNGYRGKNSSVARLAYQSPRGPVRLSDSVDWRTQGYVTPVKDQGQCGSCWAFSSTGSLEGQLFAKTGSLVSLSEQNLVDCTLAWGNNGCQGGTMDNSFQYVKDNYGIDTEDAYPYIGQDGTCHYDASASGGRDVDFVDMTRGSESELKEAVASIGPISIGIDASQPSFQLYKSGVYNELSCTKSIDHAVLAVGYGTLGTQDYWLVKNSWGESWGMDGYILMSRNQGNQCGIASMASYPKV